MLFKGLSTLTLTIILLFAAVVFVALVANDARAAMFARIGR